MSSRFPFIPEIINRKWSQAFRLRWYRFSFLIVAVGGLIVTVVRLWKLSQIIPIVFQMDLKDAIHDPRWSIAIENMVWDSLRTPITVVVLCWIVLATAPVFISENRVSGKSLNCK